ncbi:hypothetical protein KCP74_15400 [Salmonella enterica subsp. enterica]|nr:hypothetical protein KCP74_15400 [Salmonella enterica subsp. enterica]
MKQYACSPGGVSHIHNGLFGNYDGSPDWTAALQIISCCFPRVQTRR